ncbi:MAG: 2-dehydropantoate 2-reductase [Steroidobacteraceae bacterium]
MHAVEYAIVGAGAIGSIIGAHLAHAGHSVAMLVREHRAAQLRRDGLRIRGLVEFAVPVTVLTTAAQLSSADVLIVAMKTPGTEAALAPLRSTPIGTALSIQNGVWKDEVLTEAFGAERVLGALANTSGELMPDGDVLFTRNVNLLVGELTGGLSARAQRIAARIDASGVRSTAVPDVLAREWTKFIAWVPLMSLSITTRALTWRYLSEPHSAAVIVHLMREVAKLARAHGIELVDDQSLLPQAVILNGSNEVAIEAVLAVGHQYRVNAPEHRLSSLQDLLAGRPLEVEETLGHAARLATKLNVSAPLLESFYHLGAAIDRCREV